MIAQMFALEVYRTMMPCFPFRVDMHSQGNLFSIAGNEISRRRNEFALSPILFSAEKTCGIALLSNEEIQKIISGGIRTNVRFNP